MNIKSILSTKVKELMKAKDLKQADIVRATGLTQASVSRFINKGEISTEKLKKFCNYYNLSLDDLLNSKYLELNSVPLLSYVQAGNWTEHTEFSDVEEIEVPGVTKDRYFALKVCGDSMSRNSGKSIFDGSYVLVDPNCSKNKEDLNHKVVIARHENETLIKEFVLDGTQIFLKPWNDQYEVIKFTKDTVIIGTVIRVWSDL